MLGLPRCTFLSSCTNFTNRQFVAMLAALLCLLAVRPASLCAQSASSTNISGVVTDSSGAVIADANVKLTDKATHTPRSTNTNDQGRYFLADVISGEYEITVSKAGFRITRTTVTASVGIPLTVDLRLEIGAVTETVEVTATNTELQTMNATIGNTVNSASLDALPSLNRDISTFVELQPGVSPDGSVGGAAVDQSTFMLDGGNNTNDMDGSMSVYTPSFAGDPTGGISNQSFAVAAGPTGVLPTPADSVEEFKVNTAGQTADFNSSSGAQVQVVTRRGTDSLHGSVYDYYLDNNFSANTWDNNASGTPLPDWHRSRFGARAGGPVLPKRLGGKTYIFGNYEGYRWPNSTTVERAVPSANMRLGLLTFGGVTYNLNPTTVNGIAPSVCPAGPCDPRGLGINPLVQQMWNTYMPLPNEASCNLSRCDGVNVQGFKANVAIPQTSNFGVLRIDHDFSDKWHFTASYRYFKLLSAGTQQVDIGGFFSGDKLGVPASRSNNPQLPWYYVVGLTTNISTHVTNDFHYSFLRNWWSWARSGDTPQFANLGGALEPFG